MFVVESFSPVFVVDMHELKVLYACFLFPVDQRNLGMSMRIERSSVDQVRKRFEQNKKKLDEKKKEYDFEERIKELKEEV